MNEEIARDKQKMTKTKNDIPYTKKKSKKNRGERKIWKICKQLVVIFVVIRTK